MLIANVSHITKTTDLQSHGKTTVLVKRVRSFVTDDKERYYSEVIGMEEMIEKYCDTYAKDLEERQCLQKDKLPTAMASSTLLNPIFGLRQVIVVCGLMSDRQYNQARRDLVRMIHDILDARSPTIDVELLASDNYDRGSDDEALPVTQNINFNLADKEVSDFKSFKLNIYWPSFAKKEEGLTGMFQGSLKEIVVGTSITHGKDLPLGDNLFDYIDKQGRMCLIRFFEDHKDRFPNMWILVQQDASHQVVEIRSELLLVFLGTFLPHGTQGLESGTMSGLIC